MGEFRWRLAYVAAPILRLAADAVVDRVSPWSGVPTVRILYET